MRSLIIIIFFSVLFIKDSFAAYPIPPVPLRELSMEAELIVDAYVIDDSDDEEKDPFQWDSGTAYLNINSILKGVTTLEVIEVKYNAGMICPAPAHYEPGKRVLAFLNKQKDSESYYTVSLSYGSKELDEACMIVYKNRVKEILLINQLQDEQSRIKETTDWIVQCALNK